MANTLATFWAGPPLGAIEQISALSFLAAGHRLIVYTPGDLQGVPAGVEVRDAREILDTRIITHRKTGSVALYSDLFRYALFGKTDQTWVDLDVVALRPLPLGQPYIFGYESADEVNGAVLRLPAASPALAHLSGFSADTRGYPPAMKGFRRFRYIVKSFGMGLPIQDWPWGSIGPRALTHFLNATGEIAHARPKETFYPVPFGEAERFAMPGELDFDSFPDTTVSVHLWGKFLRRILDEKYGSRIPEGSFLGIAQSRFGRTCSDAIPA